MKHLKKFNESNLPSGLRFRTLMRRVKGNGHYTDNDAQQQAWNYIKNVEKATGKEVSSVEGHAWEDSVDLDVKLSDGSNITIWFGEDRDRSSWGNSSYPGQHDKFKVTYDGEYRDSKQSQFRKLKDELNEEYWENEVYYLLKDMVPEPEPEPTHVIELPLDNDEVFDYYENEVCFLSEEDAKKWIESLKIKIIKD